MRLLALSLCIGSVCCGQTIQSVVNAATYTANVAPGSWVSIFGTQLAPGAMAAQSAPFPTQLNNVSVTVNGLAAPLNYVSAAQINALIPFEAATLAGSAQTSAQVVVTTPSGASKAFALTLQRNAPAIYTKDSSGSGNALAFDQNFKAIAAVGSSPLVLYATGLGPTNPPAATNALGSSTVPLNMIQDPVSVSIGGSAATVLFAGLAPGLHAVYQINIQPPQTFLGNTLSITAGNYSGKSLTLPVMAGTNVANATATVSALYPTAGTTLGFSALLVAGSFTTAFDVVPGAKAFQVVVLGNGNALATINIDPVGNTWQATYPVPTALARNYNFAGAGVVVYDYLAGMPFPGNIIPLSRLDLAAVSAAGMLPLPNSAAVNGANGTWTASGTLPAGGHFAINSSSLTQLQNFGAFTFLPSNEPGGSYPATFTVYVDNMQVASSTLQFAIQ